VAIGDLLLGPGRADGDPIAHVPVAPAIDVGLDYAAEIN
jgi:hypothetical protein